jgi:hypothetical protein
MPFFLSVSIVPLRSEMHIRHMADTCTLRLAGSGSAALQKQLKSSEISGDRFRGLLNHVRAV